MIIGITAPTLITSSNIEMITDNYGDLGFAYVDVQPIPTFDDKNAKVDIDNSFPEYIVKNKDIFKDWIV